jgi:hypothetical protein
MDGCVKEREKMTSQDNQEKPMTLEEKQKDFCKMLGLILHQGFAFANQEAILWGLLTLASCQHKWNAMPPEVHDKIKT